MFPAARSHACALTLLLAAPAAGDLEGDLARGDFAAAERELELIAGEWRETDPESPELARTLLALGVVERRLGKPAEASVHLEESLELLPTDAPERAEIREALALALQDQGRLDEAEPLLRQNLDRGDPRTLDHLGILLLQKGRYRESGEQLRQALELTPADEAHQRARRLGQLARFHHVLGSHARALDTLEAALALDPADPDLRLSLHSAKALAHLRLHDIETAATVFEECADLARKRFRDRPLEALPHLNNLGSLALTTGDPDTARALFDESLGILREAGKDDQPAAAATLNNLGVAHQRLGDYRKSTEFLEAALSAQTGDHRPDLLRIAETSRNLAATAVLAGRPDAGDAVRHANRLGLELLERLLRQGSETERLNFLQQLDLVSLSATLGDADALAGLLLASKARLLDQLIRPGEPVATPAADDLRARLPADAAFIDFCRYAPPGDEARYGAVLHTHDARPQWIPLTDEATLRGWLDALELRLEWKAAELAGDSPAPPAFRLPGILRELHRECFEPVLEALPPDCRRLAVSPDGLVHGIPFAALRDADGRHLVESLALVVRVDSGRDLLAPPATPRLDSGAWTVVGVDRFERRVTPADSRLAEVLAELPPLPGTHDELKRLRSLAPDGSRFLRNPHEPGLETGTPAVLHFATHSFFLDPGPGPLLDFDRSAERLHAGGIALPRAPLLTGEMASPGDDDILFPREIATLPLQDTRLVVLSSCRSGAGTGIRGGESLGLRRAFALAGADEVLSALWPVADASTPVFMQRFYELALATDHPAQALWRTQREHLAEAGDPEAAILRAAPYLLTQRGPFREIHAMEPPASAFPWKWMLLLVPVGLLAVGRQLRRR